MKEGVERRKNLTIGVELTEGAVFCEKWYFFFVRKSIQVTTRSLGTNVL